MFIAVGLAAGVCLSLISMLATGVALAGEPAGGTGAAGPPEAQEKPKEDPNLGMSILGNQEAPKSLVIVPWKRSEMGDAMGISTLLDDSRLPIDKEVFMRDALRRQTRLLSQAALRRLALTYGTQFEKVAGLIRQQPALHPRIEQVPGPGIETEHDDFGTIRQVASPVRVGDVLECTPSIADISYRGRNELMTVLNVYIPPQRTSGYHRHSLDTVGVLTVPVEAAVSEEVVVAGVAPSIEAAPGSAMTLISSREVALRSPANLMQAVESVAGVSQVSEGQAAVPAVRGLARGRTLVLIDGSRVSSERRVGPSAGFLDPSVVEGVDVRDERAKAVGLGGELTANRLDERRKVVGELDPPAREDDRRPDLRRQVDSDRAMREMSGRYRRAFDLLETSAARDAFDLSAEPESVRRRYGLNRLLSRRDEHDSGHDQRQRR